MNMVEPDNVQVTIWRMRIACWIPKAANTHSEYATLIVLELQQWLQERASVSRDTYSGCLVTLCVVATLRVLFVSFGLVRFGG